MTCVICHRTFRAGLSDEPYCAYCKRDCNKAILADVINKVADTSPPPPPTILCVCVICGAVYKCPVSATRKRRTCSQRCDNIYMYQAHIKHVAKHWLLTAPDGETYQIYNLKKWICDNTDKHHARPNTMYVELMKAKRTGKRWRGWMLQQYPGKDTPTCPTDAPT